jgi:hypothetical protein
MSPEQTIAHYRITAKLGEREIGAVYPATTLGSIARWRSRSLPAALASDAIYARFEREAQVLASLNHRRRKNRIARSETPHGPLTMCHLQHRV